ncbi:Hypothetical predicted protein [Octopus vulgaris]|uniref:Uncharacterized protein n=1 Tax=Octopus vulgaris TaxID=6645 RepID=A0AA36F616_OCTVU|nr:Hypothetical predicted protein [Octopus vulgaris]
MADKEDTENSPAQDIVVTKYKMVGDMVNRIRKLVIGGCKAGKSVILICKFGDELLLEETSKNMFFHLICRTVERVRKTIDSDNADSPIAK